MGIKNFYFNADTEEKFVISMNKIIDSFPLCEEFEASLSNGLFEVKVLEAEK